MSDKLDIEAIKARVRDAERSLDDQNSYWCRSDLARRLVADLAALLAEVERLQRERSEWCDQADRRLTDYMTQQRDLLAENAALRARLTRTKRRARRARVIVAAQRERLTLTPERVEAAARALSAAYEHKYDCDPCEWDDIHPLIQNEYRAEARAALLAAGMEEEQ